MNMHFSRSRSLFILCERREHHSPTLIEREHEWRSKTTHKCHSLIFKGCEQRLYFREYERLNIINMTFFFLPFEPFIVF